jgi:hypothetical protein
MTPELQERFIQVAHNLDKLDQMQNLIDDETNTSPRSLIASAAVAGAEFLASATGHEGDPAIIHRAYEEIFAAIENSAAINEMLTVTKTASVEHSERCAAAISSLQGFRRSIAGQGGEDA